MNIIESLALFGIMAALAAIPGSSVALVIARSASSGTSNGIAVAAGIVLGDLTFILLALIGLSAVAETMGGVFMAIRYMGAGYLFWLGYTLLAATHTAINTSRNTGAKSTLLASFSAGYLLTLGDIKAIAFYVSLLPAFIDMPALQLTDLLTIVAVTVVSVGGVKVLYALAARKLVSLAHDLEVEKAARKAAGGFMIGAGAYLFIKT